MNFWGWKVNRTLLDLDDHGKVVAITMEHASERADIRNLSLEGLVA